MTRTRQQRGFALLIVLWTLPLLTLIGLQLTASGRFETRLAANLRSSARAEAAADGAVRDAVFRLATGAWVANGSSHEIQTGDALVSVSAEDHAGRIDPNVTETALLVALFRQVGLPEGRARNLVEALEQWRMESDALPAIAARYRAAGLAYAPTGKAFRSIAELGLVLGMTPAILATLAPHVSVYRGMDADPRFADPVVLAAMRTSGVLTDPARIGDPLTRPLIVGIEAVATDLAGARFVRRAIVRIAAVDRTNPRPWRILEWSAE